MKIYVLKSCPFQVAKVTLKMGIMITKIWRSIQRRGPFKLFISPSKQMVSLNHFIIQLFYKMNNIQSPYFPFVNHYPFLYYQSWSNPNYFCQGGPTIIQKDFQTKDSLFETPKPVRKQNEQISDQKAKYRSSSLKWQSQKVKLQKRKERQDNYERKKQKKDRNLPSNIFKNLANFIYTNPDIKSYLQALTPSTITASPERLVQVFTQTIKFGQSYIRPALIQSLCRQGLLSKEDSLVFRILLRKFLLLELPLILMNQPKLKKKQRLQYIKMGRKLHSEFRNGVLQ